MIYRLHTDSADSGSRLDQFLQQRIPEISRTKIRKIIDLGGVHVAGRRIRQCSFTVPADQRIEVHRDQQPLDPYRISAADILFQDRYVIALNKPAGVDTQPTMARYKGTLYEALQVWLKRDGRFGRRLEIGMAQRLDKNTSGIIIFSIHPRSHKGLTRQLQERTAVKVYLAMVLGTPDPPAGIYRSMLARERKSNRVKTVSNGGKEAITRYHVLRSFGGASMVKVELLTGRMHQIRAHFSEHGHPLLGDTRYDGPDYFENHHYARQSLHSW
ncbi:MAG: RluA family pseudouridine synthase, partial [Desulforhopalus sp.]